MTLIDRGDAPQKASTMENLKSTAKSVLARGFSVDRRSLRNKVVEETEKHDDFRVLKIAGSSTSESSVASPTD